jgi:TetR/AcrR family transcriptional regulator, transcriptional repressor for nem operon
MDETMSKGERTRRRIVERSAPIFNTRGYSGTSVGEVAREAELEKAGIYNHFSGKEDLALAAFDFSTGIMRRRFEKALEGEEGVLVRLLAIVDEFGRLIEDPPVAGGCAMLNTAVESDDAYPVLKERAAWVATDWLRLVGGLVKEGVASGELKADPDPRETATVVVATLEGALMLGKLLDDPEHLRRAERHVTRYLRSLTREPRS